MFDLPAPASPERELALLVAGRLPPDAVPPDRWDKLVPLALDHALGGMLLWSLRRAGGVPDGDPRWAPLVEATRRDGRWNLLLEKARWQAASALHEAGVGAIWLKGSALAYTCYPQPHLRPMDDLDVLVSPHQRGAARQALLGQGFRPAEIDFFELAGFTDQARHHENLLDPAGRVRLEMHFRLLAPAFYDWPEDEALDWFWGQTEQLVPAGAPLPADFQVLRPEANLLYLCAHAILQNHSARLDLLHLLDLHLLLAQGGLDWDRLVEQAVALRWTRAVGQALGLLPDLFGAQLPQGLLEQLQRRRPEGEPIPARVNGNGGTRRWAEWRYAFYHMTASQRLRLVWRTLFPPVAFMRRQYGLSSTQSLLPYYWVHFVDGGREVRRALRHLTFGR